MKNPQIINLNEDNIIAIDGESVIDDTTQALMSATETTINVDIDFFDIMTGLAVAEVTNKVMTYQSASDFWTIEVSDFSSSLTDRHKYVAKVSTATTPPESANMRDFKISEFAVDNESFEAIWMRLPYEVDISAGKIKWYETTPGVGPALFSANIYEGGTGTTAATDASRVTHRGSIEAA